MERDGYILQFPQPKDKPYLYMPNPAKIHHHSAKLQHHLYLVDLYIRYGKPEKFSLEPKITPEYIPDVYMVKNNKAVIIEAQLSRISNGKMQNKVDMFVDTLLKGKHRVNELWIMCNDEYVLQHPSSVVVKQKPLTIT